MEDELNQATENTDQANSIIDDDNDPEWDSVTWSYNDDDDDDGEGGSDKTDEAEDTNPQTEGESAPTETAEAEPAPDSTDEEGNQFLELKHFDEVRKVNRQEAKELAQKGLDYDHIRGERDALRNEMPRYKAMEEFLNEIRGDQFGSIDELMDDTRARVLSDKEGISYDDALERVKANRKTVATAPEEPQPANNRSAVDDFIQKYPGVKAEEIPESVWAEVRETGDLVGAYERHKNNEKDARIKALEAEIETLKQNEKNKARSTGSGMSSGNSRTTIEDLWDNGE